MSCLTVCYPRPVAHQAPLMECSRQEYWSGLPFPPPGDLPDPGIEPKSPALAGGFFTAELPGKPLFIVLGGDRDKWCVFKIFGVRMLLVGPGIRISTLHSCHPSFCCPWMVDAHVCVETDTRSYSKAGQVGAEGKPSLDWSFDCDLLAVVQ